MQRDRRNFVRNFTLATTSLLFTPTIIQFAEACFPNIFIEPPKSKPKPEFRIEKKRIKTNKLHFLRNEEMFDKENKLDVQSTIEKLRRYYATGMNIVYREEVHGKDFERIADYCELAPDMKFLIDFDLQYYSRLVRRSINETPLSEKLAKLSLSHKNLIGMTLDDAAESFNYNFLSNERFDQIVQIVKPINSLFQIIPVIYWSNLREDVKKTFQKADSFVFCDQEFSHEIIEERLYNAKQFFGKPVICTLVYSTGTSWNNGQPTSVSYYKSVLPKVYRNSGGIITYGVDKSHSEILRKFFADNAEEEIEIKVPIPEIEEPIQSRGPTFYPNPYAT